MIADRKSSLINDNTLLTGSRSSKNATGNNIGHLKPKDLKITKIKTRNADFNSERSKTVEP